MMRRTVVFALVCGIAAVAHAQEGEAPKPGPGHEKLGYFVGKWQSEGEMAESPFGPGGKMSSRDDCTWFEGKFAVICHSKGQTPLGPVKGIGIMSYSPDAEVYTYYGVDSTGMAMLSVPRGTVEGSTWTYLDESPMGDQVVKSRYVIKELTADSYSFRWEMEGEDGSWTTIAKGTSTRK